MRDGRRELFLESFADLRALHGSDALKRMDRALAGYLKELDLAPPDAQQRPRFFYFPGSARPALSRPGPSTLVREGCGRPSRPFAPKHCPCCARSQRTLPDFIQCQEPIDAGRIPRWRSANPTWQAYFFYRHGKRFDANHARCPATSQHAGITGPLPHRRAGARNLLLGTAAATLIKPHHGVTNVRVVMHLPLLVPPDCALNVVGREHPLARGRAHDVRRHLPARSLESFGHHRVILLMDCWNPHLTAVETSAVTQLIERSAALHPRGARDRRTPTIRLAPRKKGLAAFGKPLSVCSRQDQNLNDSCA